MCPPPPPCPRDHCAAGVFELWLWRSVLFVRSTCLIGYCRTTDLFRVHHDHSPREFFDMRTEERLSKFPFFVFVFFFRCVALNSNTVRLLCRIAQARRTLMMPMSLVLQMLPPRVSLRRLPREMARGRYAPLHHHRHRWRRRRRQRRSKPSRPRSRRSSPEQTDIGGGYKRIAGFMPPEARLRGAPT